jgi:hypothetical protein
MRVGFARITAVLAVLLFVTMGLVHVTHAHEPEQASSFHPACTLCQFQAPSASLGDVQGYTAEPGVASHFTTPGVEPAPVDAPAGVHTSRAPPALLAN